MVFMIGTILYEIVHYLSNGYYLGANLNFYTSKIGFYIFGLNTGLVGLDKIINYILDSTAILPLLLISLIFGFIGELLQKIK